ncbi:hypothetical protein Cni_G28589 [Canna indica]|uniref:Gamma-glutamylcyclotransferase AIG2-like domain-containing protein n=1 Tax=Canna indica TaxID=4628 RepID=A0AAQ3LA19_9LILI|nr:hypothetical protein Cni_G28589 [Canna indica]
MPWEAVGGESVKVVLEKARSLLVWSWFVWFERNSIVFNGSSSSAVLVFLGITDVELNLLDAFEDVEYERKNVEISLLDKSEKLLVYAYVWSDKNDPDLYGEWDFEVWERLHKKDFVAMTSGFMDELEQPDSKTRVATYESYYQG